MASKREMTKVGKEGGRWGGERGESGMRRDGECWGFEGGGMREREESDIATRSLRRLNRVSHLRPRHLQSHLLSSEGG